MNKMDCGMPWNREEKMICDHRALLCECVRSAPVYTLIKGVLLLTITQTLLWFGTLAPFLLLYYRLFSTRAKQNDKKKNDTEHYPVFCFMSVFLFCFVCFCFIWTDAMHSWRVRAVLVVFVPNKLLAEPFNFIFLFLFFHLLALFIMWCGFC